MPLDKWIAAVLLAGGIAYGYAAVTYPILPFERFSPIQPNTLPMGLAVLAVGLALLILIAPRAPAEGAKAGEIDVTRLGEYKLWQAAALIGAMIAYALLLRPAGFVLSTVGFLVGAGAILGERRWLLMIAIAAIGAGLIWLIVDRALGIFLAPLPRWG
ncbi:MAG: tripartite tricarboxylate transporter TctB family protein [Paracoccaceae bacterium]